MTSLEHESNDTSVSASDYGADNWDQENWGDMDVSLKLVDLFVAKLINFRFDRHHKIHHHLLLLQRQFWVPIST